MFKRVKQTKNDEVFKQPSVKHSMEIKTHLREKTDIEKIYHMFSIPSKRKSVFRMILSLPQPELDRNLYMLTEQLLKTLVMDINIDRLLYSALSRLFKSKNSTAVEGLCVGYLKAQMSYDKYYYTFIEFIIRHFKTAIVRSKQEIAQFVVDAGLKKRILALEEKARFDKVKYEEPFYYVR